MHRGKARNVSMQQQGGELGLQCRYFLLLNDLADHLVQIIRNSWSVADDTGQRSGEWPTVRPAAFQAGPSRSCATATACVSACASATVTVSAFQAGPSKS